MQKKILPVLLFIFVLGVIFYLLNAKGFIKVRKLTPVPSPTAQTGMANPASVNCVDKGGQLTIKKNQNGDEYGVCTFSDNRQCEEWALFRGDCPEGGVKVTGYTNDAEIYCAITGGKITSGETKCTLPDGTTCDINNFTNNTCLVY